MEATIKVNSRAALPGALKEVIIKGIQRNGRRVFDLSQNNERGFVPVKTGKLKASGTFTSNGDKGYVIQYDTDYASAIEIGRTTDGNASTVTTVEVPGKFVAAHYTKGGKWVPAKWRPPYTRKLKGKKVVKTDTGFITINLGKTKGQLYLGRAFEQILPQIDKDIVVELT